MSPNSHLVIVADLVYTTANTIGVDPVRIQFVLFFCLTTTVFGSENALATQPCISCMQRPFDAIKKALATKNKALFSKQWHPKGLAENLVGKSGLSGERAYEQGSRKGWYLKPDFSQLRSIPDRRGAPWIVPCDIWSVKKARAVDKVYAIFADEEKTPVLLGAGERLSEVEALGQRYVEKKDLSPPKAK